MELEAYKTNMTNAIKEPSRKFEEVFRTVFGPLGLMKDPYSILFKKLEQRNVTLLQQLQDAIEVHNKQLAIQNNIEKRGYIKANRVQLNTILYQSEKLIEQEFSSKFLLFIIFFFNEL